MRRLLTLLLIFSCTSLGVFAQTSLTPTYENDVYYQAFVAFLKKRIEVYGENEGRRKLVSGTVIVERDEELNSGFPLVVGQNDVLYLDYLGRKAYFDRTHKPFSMIVFHPMTKVGERMMINFSEQKWSYKKKVQYYAVSDGAKVFFRYDCEKKDLVIDEVVL